MRLPIAVPIPIAHVMLLLSGFCLFPCAVCAQSPPMLITEGEAILQTAAGEQDLIRLIQIDLSLSEELDSDSRRLCRRILQRLAVSEDQTAREHVRSVFENEPERRSMAAWALSQATSVRPTDLQDWRYMVRSLTVVSEEDSPGVLSALRRFRIRANKPQWVRQVILVGLNLPTDQQSTALDLLQHWTEVPGTSAGEKWTLADYQNWFTRTYPELPEARHPEDPAGSRWTWATLTETLNGLDHSADQIARGQAVYDKAGCRKCHRHGASGDAFGPDLTSLGWRRQKHEILRALLYPSHDLDEEYPSVSVVLKNGKTLSGVLARGEGENLEVMSPAGVRESVLKTDIEQTVPLKTSIMPSGTLEPLTLEEIEALFSFLTNVDGVPKPHRDDGV